MLAMITLKDYVWGAIVAALLVAIGWFAWHERAIVYAADAKVVAAKEIHDIEVEDAAKDRVADALRQFQASHSAPAAPAPAIVCTAAAPRAGAVPSHGGAPAGSHGAPAVPEESTGPSHAPGFDPAPAVIQDGADADAQIELLQSIIRAYQAAGAVKK
jgi:hypothetical protein